MTSTALWRTTGVMNNNSGHRPCKFLMALIFHDPAAALHAGVGLRKAALLQTSSKAAAACGGRSMGLAMSMWFPPQNEGIDGPTLRMLLRPLYTLRFWVEPR